ncbi:farnesyl diphosphate synthase [Tieghemostelium lacteum]|uniref:Farnesyl diphosphate synthase n=1 Tax=Tieghemostelium lacteum TaxID=361077 RepID=A0A151Z8S6_TIELA|nr:farnesyl diphosphate synthase [Tieghemostelium lacteum]|eukprot:KYQ90347.1 farnesyl diphosphate synthase [Tieghemostelium lacteum]
MSKPLVTKEEHKEFLDVFQILKKDILEAIGELNVSKEIFGWVRESIEVNIPGGKLTRGLTIYNTVKSLKIGFLSDQEKFEARVLGWCVEWLGSVYLVFDDVMDGGTIRRGHPCWYKCLNPLNRQVPIGNIAIFDGLILEECMYKILKKYFKHKAYYGDLVELIHDVNWKSYIGQLMDSDVSIFERGDFSEFTMTRFRQIMIYKTAYYTFYLPVVAGMLISGMELQYIESLDGLKDILIELGIFMNAQDDFFDSFSDPKITLKIGTDIEENKITWLICKALTMVNPDQLSLLKQHYGRTSPNDRAIVKKIYLEIGLEKEFRIYEDQTYLDIMKSIDTNEINIPKEILITILENCYKRVK